MKPAQIKLTLETFKKQNIRKWVLSKCTNRTEMIL